MLLENPKRQEEIREAAQIAQLDDYIQTLPDKYDTPIGERGVKLSGGQAQRLSIPVVSLLLIRSY